MEVLKFRPLKRKRSEDDGPQKDNDDPTKSTDILPSITRKITACAACRKQKIKCDMSNDGPPCVRCDRRGLNCILNKSLQTLVEDARNTEILQADVRNIHETLDQICQHLKILPPKALLSNSNTVPPVNTQNRVTNDIEKDQDNACEVSPPDSPAAVQAPIDTFLDIAKLGSPGSSNTPQSLRRRPSMQQEDLIGKGIIDVATAEKLTHRYFSRLDHYLYGVCSDFTDWIKLRQTSPILLAAICTVSAFHDPQNQTLYEACNREFRRLVTRSTFEKRDINYIRAICISSFWLADASRIFSSDAIRRASDMRLHQSFKHVFHKSHESSSTTSPTSILDTTDRVRLWYLLFICDQHLSILHNRDALLRSDKEISVSWEIYLEREDVTENEIRILSQVALLQIMGQTRDILGSELETQLPKALANQLGNFSRQLDKWFNRFSAMFKPNPYVGHFPMQGLQMHYHFGKLYLGHSVFKGLGPDPIPSYFLTAANMAHDAAVAIFEMILTEKELQESLVGMPHYFHIMIAFAGQFLLDVCKKYHDQLTINLEANFSLISNVLKLFEATPCIPQHPIRRMTPGLKWRLYDYAASLQRDPNGVPLGKGSSEVAHKLELPSPVIRQQPADEIAVVNFAAQDEPIPVEDLFYTDFGEFQFPDMWSNFVT